VCIILSQIWYVKMKKILENIPSCFLKFISAIFFVIIYLPFWFSQYVARFLVLCVCFVDRCLSFCPLCCLSFSDLWLLIIPLVSSNFFLQNYKFDRKNPSHHLLFYIRDLLTWAILTGDVIINFVSVFRTITIQFSVLLNFWKSE
jgi:hypothetical protein